MIEIQNSGNRADINVPNSRTWDIVPPMYACRLCTRAARKLPKIFNLCDPYQLPIATSPILVQIDHKRSAGALPIMIITYSRSLAGEYSSKKVARGLYLVGMAS
jgi:hypothetical protein